MNISALTTDDLKKYIENIMLEQARRHNGTEIHSDNEEIAVMGNGALKIEADAARQELNRRTAKPTFRATFN
jgi:hypothetical protein